MSKLTPFFLIAAAVAACGQAPCEGAGVVCHVAGTAGLAGADGDNELATAARLYWPQDMVVSADGAKIYVVDFNNHRVREVGADGVIRTIIGTGALGDQSTGKATEINLNHPTSLTIGPDSNLYLAAWHNWKIKKVDVARNEVSIAAGTLQGFLGDGADALQAKMDLPSSLVFDAAGDFYVSDQGNQRIRKISGGVITTFAGGDKGFADGVGVAAKFSFPKGPNAVPGGKIAIGPDGDELYVADTDNHRIRKIAIATGEVTTLAGTGEAGFAGDNGPALSAQLNTPTDVAVGPAHDVYVADSKNHVVRRIDATGLITTVVGTGKAGSSPEGTPAGQAQLHLPSGVAFHGGALYIADTNNHVIVKVQQ